MHNLCLIGRTGSGKSTLAAKLSSTYSLPVISSGNIARDIALSDRSVSLALDAGAVAPEVPIRSEVKRKIEEHEIKEGGWILDGFPRSVAQLIALYEWTLPNPVIFVVVDVATHECIRRLVQRGRLDDAPDAMARRLDSFRQTTSKILDILPDSLLITYGNEWYSDYASLVSKLDARSESLTNLADRPSES